MLRVMAILAAGMFSICVNASPLPSTPHVYVEGSATVEVEPDEMTFSIEIAYTAPTLEVAKQSVDTRSFELIRLCKELGIASDDIATTALRIHPEYSYDNNRRIPEGTHVSRQVDIHLRDLSQYPAVMDAFVKADISQAISTKLIVSNESEFTDKALAEALVDARKRAEILAKSAGRKLGDPHSISEFMTRGEERYMLQVSRAIVGKSSDVMMQEVAVSGSYRSEPFEPGVMVAKAEVYVVYLLQ